jgi:hypothetical protein
MILLSKEAVTVQGDVSIFYVVQVREQKSRGGGLFATPLEVKNTIVCDRGNEEKSNLDHS